MSQASATWLGVASLRSAQACTSSTLWGRFSGDMRVVPAWKSPGAKVVASSIAPREEAVAQGGEGHEADAELGAEGQHRLFGAAPKHGVLVLPRRDGQRRVGAAQGVGAHLRGAPVELEMLSRRRAYPSRKPWPSACFQPAISGPESADRKRWRRFDGRRARGRLVLTAQSEPVDESASVSQLPKVDLAKFGEPVHPQGHEHCEPHNHWED